MPLWHCYNAESEQPCNVTPHARPSDPPTITGFPLARTGRCCFGSRQSR